MNPRIKLFLSACLFLLAVGFGGCVFLAQAPVAHAAGGYGCTVQDDTTGATSMQCSPGGKSDCSDILNSDGDDACSPDSCSPQASCPAATGRGQSRREEARREGLPAASPFRTHLAVPIGPPASRPCSGDWIIWPFRSSASSFCGVGFRSCPRAGNEEKVKTGKNTIVYAVVGYAIILLASGVATLIQNIVNSTPASH